MLSLDGIVNLDEGEGRGRGGEERREEMRRRREGEEEKEECLLFPKTHNLSNEAEREVDFIDVGLTSHISFQFWKTTQQPSLFLFLSFLLSFY